MEYSAGGESRLLASVPGAEHLYGKDVWESRTAEPGTVTRTCNPGTWKTDAAGGCQKLRLFQAPQ